MKLSISKHLWQLYIFIYINLGSVRKERSTRTVSEFNQANAGADSVDHVRSKTCTIARDCSRRRQPRTNKEFCVYF